MKLGDERFDYDSTRVKTDWPGVIFQIENALRTGRKRVFSESMCNLLLERIEAERQAYRADLESERDQRLRELQDLYGGDVKWPLIRADHRNQYRAALRAKMRWLDVWEEALDLSLIRAIHSVLGREAPL